MPGVVGIGSFWFLRFRVGGLYGFALMLEVFFREPHEDVDIQWESHPVTII